jgi:hypothetical protein
VNAAAIAQLFTTLMVGLIGGYIAWRQWRTSHDRLTLDLFERRFDNFQELSRAVRVAINKPHSIPTLPSTSRLSLKVLPFLVAVPCQIPKVSLCSPWTLEYPRPSNRDFASRSVRLAAGLINRDNGGADESVGDDRVVCAEAELAINKPNIQIALRRAFPSLLLKRVKRRTVIFSLVIDGADSPNRRNSHARP